MRRTVATQLTEMAIPLELVAAVIGHEAGGRETRTLVRHYVRTDFSIGKKTILEAWDRRLSEIIEGKLPVRKCDLFLEQQGSLTLVTEVDVPG